MANNDHLFNAVVIGENPNTAFIVENNRLHAVEKSIADQKKDKSNPKVVLPLMREALKALIKFSEGKIEGHFLSIDWKEITGKPNEQQLLIQKIDHIFSHLPHQDRQELSSLIHHKQTTPRRGG
jgi:hypothetical protein